jgi:hypothetical protein
MSLVSLVGYLFAAYVTVTCVRRLAKGGLKEDFSVFKGRTWQTWIQVLVGDVLAVSVLTIAAIYSDRAPNWLQFSWLTLLAGKGEQVQSSNLMLAGAQIPLFGIPFILLLVLNLPQFAAAEEEMFRDGTKDWLQAIPRSLGFGLMHMIVGVPLWCGLALAVPGMWFTAQYFKGGLSRSTMAHAVYNFMLIGVLFWYVLFLNYQSLFGKTPVAPHPKPPAHHAPVHIGPTADRP